MKIISIATFALQYLWFGMLVLNNAGATDMPPLAKSNQCTACHKIDKRLLGPAWMEVSKKYKGVTRYVYKDKEYTLEEGLATKVAKGGSGNWGTMPMPANFPTVSEADIKELVKFILNLAK